MAQIPFRDYFQSCAALRGDGREPIRLFHGPGEGRNTAERSLAAERFGDLLWVTEWEDLRAGSEPTRLIEDIRNYARDAAIPSVVHLKRPQKGPAPLPVVLSGTESIAPFSVTEGGANYEIRVEGSRHPGLFLDHAPLRTWLRTSPHVRGRRTLNLFAYTGSLSVATAQGGASEVWTLDLSKPTIEWAKRNWELNSLPTPAVFRAGDVFEELPKLARKGERFDLILSDPPSFSRGEKGVFSTQKDLAPLHEKIFALLNPGGLLVTSINSENVSWDRFEEQLLAAARAQKRDLQYLRRIDQPESFPSRASEPQSRYLKGWIARVD